MARRVGARAGRKGTHRLCSEVSSWPCEVLLDWAYGLTGKADRV